MPIGKQRQVGAQRGLNNAGCRCGRDGYRTLLTGMADEPYPESR